MYASTQTSTRLILFLLCLQHIHRILLLFAWFLSNEAVSIETYVDDRMINEYRTDGGMRELAGET
jgi:hypothetical protein